MYLKTATIFSVQITMFLNCILNLNYINAQQQEELILTSFHGSVPQRV